MEPLGCDRKAALPGNIQTSDKASPLCSVPDPYVICCLVSLTLNPIPKHPLSPGQAGAEGAREVGGRGSTTQD